MKTAFRYMLWVVAFAGSCWLAAGAGNPDVPAAGHILLLENERIIEGDIVREGNHYRIRRTVGETTVPAEGVLRLCQDLPEAYDYLRSRTNLRDVDERVRLARWCHLHGLKKEALTEINAAVELKPQSAECRRLQQALARAVEAAEKGPIVPVKAESKTSAGQAASVEIGAEEMGLFASRVQPILMNTCASCHVSSKAGNFKLTRCGEAGQASRRATQENLNAVLNQLNFAHWEASPLLTKSVSVHGADATQPPLKNRQARTFRTLEDWVRSTMANNPQLQDRAPAPAPLAVQQLPVHPEPVSPKPTGFAADNPTAGTATADKPADAKQPVARPIDAGPPDPFDPAPFNQRSTEGRKADPK